MICTHPVKINNEGTLLKVPCGKCLPCRINRSREWQYRLSRHYNFQKNGYFITLTYDDEHLPFAHYDYDNVDVPTVCKSDIQKFIRKIRDFYDHKLDINYFIGSEYGELGRPHYHALIFNLPSELVLLPSKHWKRGDPLTFTKDGYTSYINRRISDFWCNGFVAIGEINPERIGYCAKYFINKASCPYKNLLNYEKKIFNNFTLISKGIGKDEVENIKDKVRYYDLHALPNHKGTYVKLPRYFKNKIYTEDERKEQFASLDIEEYNSRYPSNGDDIDYLVTRKMTFKNKKSKL